MKFWRHYYFKLIRIFEYTLLQTFEGALVKGVFCFVLFCCCFFFFLICLWGSPRVGLRLQYKAARRLFWGVISVWVCSCGFGGIFRGCFHESTSGGLLLDTGTHYIYIFLSTHWTHYLCVLKHKHFTYFRIFSALENSHLCICIYCIHTYECICIDVCVSMFDCVCMYIF